MKKFNMFLSICATMGMLTACGETNAMPIENEVTEPVVDRYSTVINIISDKVDGDITTQSCVNSFTVGDNEYTWYRSDDEAYLYNHTNDTKVQLNTAIPLEEGIIKQKDDVIFLSATDDIVAGVSETRTYDLVNMCELETISFDYGKEGSKLNKVSTNGQWITMYEYIFTMQYDLGELYDMRWNDLQWNDYESNGVYDNYSMIIAWDGEKYVEYEE